MGRRKKIKKHLSYEELCTINENKKYVYSIYKLYLDNEVIYIGKSVNASNRIFAHWNDKEFNKIEVLYFINESDMNTIEPYLIAKFNPKNNREFRTNDSPSFDIEVSKIIVDKFTVNSRKNKCGAFSAPLLFSVFKKRWQTHCT